MPAPMMQIFSEESEGLASGVELSWLETVEGGLLFEEVRLKVPSKLLLLPS